MEYINKDEQELNEIDLPQEEYIRGYNDGYLIAKFEPHLFKEYGISEKSKTDSPYLEGMVNGKVQHEQEKIKEQLKKSREQNKNRDRER